MKKNRKRQSCISSIVFGLGTLILVSGFLCAAGQTDQTDLPTKPETLIEVTANNQIAWVLCFGKNPLRIDEIFFKGPSGEKIKVSMLRNFFPGYITEFSYVNDASVLKVFLASGFAEQNKPIPVIYSVNGKLVTGLGDGGSLETDLNTAFLKEFNKLPAGFQQGLREFYLFGINTTPGITSMINTLIFFEDGLGLEPYTVELIIKTNPDIVKAFKAEFNKCDPK